MERVRKIKRQLSMTLRGNNSGDKNLTESISSQDTGAHSDSEAMPVGGSATLRGSVRGAGGSFSMHSLLQSYSSSLHRPRSLGRSLSSYLNHTTRLGDPNPFQHDNAPVHKASAMKIRFTWVGYDGRSPAIELRPC